MSPALQDAAGQVSDAPATLGQGENPREREAEDKQLQKAVAGLHLAVVAHADRKRRPGRQIAPEACGAASTRAGQQWRRAGTTRLRAISLFIEPCLVVSS
jgi:hypothetical protein